MSKTHLFSANVGRHRDISSTDLKKRSVGEGRGRSGKVGEGRGRSGKVGEGRGRSGKDLF